MAGFHNRAVQAKTGERSTTKTVQKLGQSFWHRLQRRPLYTRIMPPIDMSKGFDTFLAFCPILRRPSDFGDTTVRLDAVKQGMFQGSHATFLRLEVLHSEEYRLRQTTFKIVLEARWKSEPNKPARIVAFGPGCITRPSEGSRFNPSPAGTRAGVEIQEQDDGLMMEINDHTRPRGFPVFIHVGLVIVHDVPAQLTVIPTTSKKTRAFVRQKTRVYPLQLDHNTAFHDVVTCGKDGGAPCSECCADFGPEHMNSAGWDCR